MTEEEQRLVNRYLELYEKYNGDIPFREWTEGGLWHYSQSLGINLKRAREITQNAVQLLNKNKSYKHFTIMEEKGKQLEVRESLRKLIVTVLGDLVQTTKDDVENNTGSVGQAYIAHIAEQTTEKVVDLVTNPLLRERLEILYEFQKHNLDILKDYKEEIKFAATLQEDIRKERAKFFAETLKDVSGTLKETGVDEDVKSRWIQELVSSYTQSLDMSGRLIKDNTIDTIDNINNDIKNQVDENSKNN